MACSLHLLNANSVRLNACFFKTIPLFYWGFCAPE